MFINALRLNSKCVNRKGCHVIHCWKDIEYSCFKDTFDIDATHKRADHRDKKTYFGLHKMLSNS